MTLGEKIQRRRGELGLSQEKLAEAVGVSRQAVSKWELDDAVPDTNKLRPLANALGMTVDGLLDDGAPPEGTPAAAPVPEKPGWFALHWYWLGLIPVVLGVLHLVMLLTIFGPVLGQILFMR